jgi:hypothetical protein
MRPVGDHAGCWPVIMAWKTGSFFQELELGVCSGEKKWK